MTSSSPIAANSLRNLLLQALCAAPLVLMPAGFLTSGAEAGQRAIAAALADPLSIFDARSPGQRGGGALTQTKPRRAFGNGPHERVLSGERTRPVAAPAAVPPIGPIIDMSRVESPFVVPVVADYSAPTSLTSGGPITPVGFGGGPPFIFGGGGGGGFGGVPPTTTPVAPTTPVTSVTPTTPNLPAVPEPGMWFMMIAGFVSIGAVLRVRARAAQPSTLRIT